jgi:FlaA1/EpsC-like NDP-sugar epimerase
LKHEEENRTSVRNGRISFRLSRGKVLQLLIDAGLLGLAFVMAYNLRFDFEVPAAHLRRALVQLPFVVALEFGALLAFRVHSFIWRYVGMRELFVFMQAAAIAAIPLLVGRLALPFGIWTIPLSVIVINVALGFGMVLGARVMRRALFERFERGRNPDGTAKRVLLIGAGRAGVLAVKELLGRPTEIDIRGFVDDDAEKVGSVIHGVRVLGTMAELEQLVRENEIDHVILTIAKASRADIRRIVERCDALSVRVRIIPGYFELLEGRVEVNRIRDVQIEDLLGRDPVELDTDSLARFLEGRVVMITGAGGSIGSELCRQVVLHEPRRLLLVERAEPALFEIERELRAARPDIEIVPLVADVGDALRMTGIFDTNRPDVVIHAAAHKHVPLMEQNPTEAIKNNVFATSELATMAGRFGADVFVQISTDKAVRPTSVMGASKRIAELVVQSRNGSYDTRFVVVRFGNVLGSAGSVVPIFREQIRTGGPVRVTHPEMVRYFMTIPEAAQLVLQAGAMGNGGEIFVLDMGEPVRIVELAETMIKLSGLKPYEDVDIVFSGIRPGEKLFEELELENETIAKTRHPKIYIGEITALPVDRIEDTLEELRQLVLRCDESAIRRVLAAATPGSRLSLDATAATPPPNGRFEAEPVNAAPPPTSAVTASPEESIRPAALLARERTA